MPPRQKQLHWLPCFQTRKNSSRSRPWEPTESAAYVRTYECGQPWKEESRTRTRGRREAEVQPRGKRERETAASEKGSHSGQLITRELTRRFQYHLFYLQHQARLDSISDENLRATSVALNGNEMNGSRKFVRRFRKIRIIGGRLFWYNGLFVTTVSHLDFLVTKKRLRDIILGASDKDNRSVAVMTEEIKGSKNLHFTESARL